MKRWLPIIFAVALGATACGDSGETTAAAAPEDDGPQSFEDIEYESPLMDFLGVDTNLDFNSDETQAQFAEDALRAEESIAQCMREQGFEYTPIDNSNFTAFSVDEEELPWGSRAWTEKYGHGISTQRFTQTQVGPDLVGWNDEQMDSIEEPQDDPNQTYVESLSVADQEAYFEALYGDEPELAPDATEAEWEEAYQDFEPNGCEFKAWNDTTSFGGPEQDFFMEFGDEIEDLYERLEADPRVADHIAEVTSCMAERGLEYIDMDDLYEEYETKMADIGPSLTGDPLIEAGLDPTTMSEEEIEAFYETAFDEELSDEDKELLGAIQAEEIEHAVATWDCNGSNLQMEVLFSDIRIEYENDFLAENADRLSEFEATAEG